MLRITLGFLVFGAVAGATITAAEPPLQETKSSTTERFNAAAEVKAYYLTLLRSDPSVQRQFDRLARKPKLYGDVHFGRSEPQVVEWFTISFATQFTAAYFGALAARKQLGGEGRSAWVVRGL